MSIWRNDRARPRELATPKFADLEAARLRSVYVGTAPTTADPLLRSTRNMAKLTENRASVSVSALPAPLGRNDLMRHSWTAVSLAAGLALGAGTIQANADPVADFYKGKTITIIIPVSAGGTYDYYGRLAAKIMEKHLPGNPTAITRNMPGAGGALSTTYVANVAPKDGTVLFSLHASAPQNQVLGITGNKYDVGTFLMIGQFLSLPSALTVWRATAPALTIEDARKKEVILGATGSGSYQYQLPALLNAFAGTKFKIVSGWKGVAQQNLAMERGEIHGRGGTLVSWAITKPEWVKENKIAHLVQIGSKRAKGFDNVPLAQELTDNQEHKKAFLLMGSTAQMGRALAGTPGIPADRAKALRAAFEMGLKDPEMLAQAKTWKLDLDPANGEELEALVKDILATPKPVVDLIKKTIDVNPKKAKKAK